MKNVQKLIHFGENKCISVITFTITHCKLTGRFKITLFYTTFKQKITGNVIIGTHFLAHLLFFKCKQDSSVGTWTAGFCQMINF